MSDTIEKTFNPVDHLMKLKGKDYLPVAARVLWFREQYGIQDGWSITTNLVEGGFKEEYAVFQAKVYHPNGHVVAMGTAVETKVKFPDYLEKAETSAIGRALAACGFGTMAALDEGEIVDAPVTTDAVEDYTCRVCGKDVDLSVAKAAQRHFGGVYCIEHGRQMKEGVAERAAAKGLACAECGHVVSEKIASASVQATGRVICLACGKKAKATEKAA